MLSVVAGAFLTPMAAGTQAASVGWRWAYYTFAIIITVMFLVFLFAYEETKRPALLDGVVSRTTEAADAARPSTDDEKKAGAAAKVHRTATTTTSGAAALPRRRRTHRLRLPWTTPTGESLWKVAYFPVFVAVLPHVLFTGVQFAAGIVWTTVLVASISIIFSAPPYNFDTAGVGYMSLGPFLGNVVGAVYAAVLSDWSVKRLARRNGGYFEPEFRLYLLLLPSLLMGGGLVMFGVTADRVSLAAGDWLGCPVGLWSCEVHPADSASRACTGSSPALGAPALPSGPAPWGTPRSPLSLMHTGRCVPFSRVPPFSPSPSTHAVF